MIDVSRARLGRIIGASLQTEIVFFCIFGIISTMFDASLIDFSGSLLKVWEVKMDPRKFSEKVELYMKYVLTGIVLIRTFTAHIYLGCYILLLYPVLFHRPTVNLMTERLIRFVRILVMLIVTKYFLIYDPTYSLGDMGRCKKTIEERPLLMLPWVVVNTVKCLLTGFISLAAGIFTCAAYNFAKSTCWEFLLAQTVDHAPSVYMFCLVICYYKDLNAVLRVTQEIDPMELQARRRRTRLMNETIMDESDSFGDKRDELISVSTIENVLQRFNTQVNKGNSRSLDTLLAQMRDHEERDAIMNNKDYGENENKSDQQTKTSNSKLLLKNSQMCKDILSNSILAAYSITRPSNSKLLLSDWKSSKTVLSSVFRFSNECHRTLFANPLFEQYAYNVSINAIVPITSLSSVLKPIQSKNHAVDRARRMVADVRNIPSEAEVRNVFPEEDSGKDATMVFSEPTRKVELEVQTSGVKHFSWIQSEDRTNTKRTPLRGHKKQRKDSSNTDRIEKNVNEVPLTEYYKNNASYSSGYRDDGYTQAFFENIVKTDPDISNSERRIIK